MDVGRVVKAMGGDRGVGRRVASVAELDRVVSEGLPKAALRKLAERYGGDDVARRRFMYSVVPRATLERRDILSPQASEKVERLARLWALAEETWDDEALARQFMAAAHVELGGKTPVEAAQTELGGRRVERILHALLYGLPA